MGSRIILAAFVMFSLNVSAEDGAQTLRYKCGNINIEVEYVAGGSSATLKGQNVKMNAQPAQSGFLFSGGHMSIRGGSRDDIELKWGRESWRKCEVVS